MDEMVFALDQLMRWHALAGLQNWAYLVNSSPPIVSIIV
jgi:hypothetical protein